MTGGKKTYEQQSYEIEDFWKKENITERDRERARFVAGIIPADVKKILDAGCGNGIFANYLVENNNFQKLYGIDRSMVALKYVKAEKVCAGLDSLPFKNGQFDLVACLEVIEHLPLEIYKKALNEICRVSKKYVLISVPNEEDLERKLISCPKCITKFNADFHMRSFDISIIRSLLDGCGYTCKKQFYIWKEIDSYRGLTYILDRIKKNTFSTYAICPVCGFHHENLSLKRNEPVVENNAKKFLKHIWLKKYKYRWIAGLYEKT